MALAMTTRIMLLSAVSIAVGSSLAYGSPGCMTISEARAKFPKAQHLYWHGSKHCWNDSAAYSFRTRGSAPGLATTRTRGGAQRLHTTDTHAFYTTGSFKTDIQDRRGRTAMPIAL